MTRLRVLPPLTGDVQMTLDGLLTEPTTDAELAAEALPLARQLALMAEALGPTSGRIGRRLVALLEAHLPAAPSRAA